MKRSLPVFLLAACASTLFAASALAQTATEAQKEALRSHCATDFREHCKGITPGGVPAFECLAKNVDSLSSACQTAVKAVDPELN